MIASSTTVQKAGELGTALNSCGPVRRRNLQVPTGTRPPVQGLSCHCSCHKATYSCAHGCWLQVCNICSMQCSSMAKVWQSCHGRLLLIHPAVIVFLEGPILGAPLVRPVKFTSFHYGFQRHLGLLRSDTRRATRQLLKSSLTY